jgi:cysteine protease ATG4
MSDPEEDEDDMPDDRDSSRSGVREDEDEDGSDDFFDAGDAVIGRTESESGGTEDDPVGPVTPSAAAPTSDRTHSRKQQPNANFSRTISADSADLDLDDDEEWVDPTPIPPTPLETAPPAFPPPPVMAKAKSSSSAKSRKRKEARAHVPFPSSVVEDAPEDRPRRVPQMSTARGRDGGRTQSGGVKGVIAPDPGPAELDDPDVDDF